MTSPAPVSWIESQSARGDKAGEAFVFRREKDDVTADHKEQFHAKIAKLSKLRQLRNLRDGGYFTIIYSVKCIME